MDSLEEVINDLSELYHDISLNESIDYDHEYITEFEDTEVDLITTELTTLKDEIDQTSKAPDSETTEAVAVITTETEETTDRNLSVQDSALMLLQTSHNLTEAWLYYYYHYYYHYYYYYYFYYNYSRMMWRY